MTTNLVSHFGKYVQVQRLGEGGFGEVYQAVDTTLNRPVALKVPHQELLRDPGFAQQFYTEAQLAAQLDHPNIVRVYSVGEYQGTPYLEMELVEGHTLAELIKQKGRFTPEEALAIIEPVCEALAEAHRKDIVHRDIKPQNILIRESDGRVLVSDFGLAKATQSSFQASLSSSNVVVGTFRYMPPEQANRKLGEIGPRSDVYSLGVVLYEMLTGRVPFESDSVGQLIYEHTTEPPEPPSNININLSRAVESVVLKALQKKPTDRFPSALVMAQALRAAVEEVIAVPPLFDSKEERPRDATEATEALGAEQRARREKLAELYEATQVALRAKRWQQAVRHCDDIAAIDASYRDVARIKIQAQAKLQEQREAEERARRKRGERDVRKREKPPVSPRRIAVGAVAIVALLMIVVLCAVGNWGLGLLRVILSPGTPEVVEKAVPVQPWPSTATIRPITEIATAETPTRIQPTDTPMPPMATRIPPTDTPVPPTATRMPPSPTPEWVAKQGGTLVLGFYQEPELLNPLIRTQTVASWAGDFMESALLEVLPDGKYYAQLAKEVPSIQNGGVSADGLTIKLNLHEGYLWEDGDEFTCNDVIFTWQAYMHPQSGAVSTTGWEDVKSITCPNDYSVVVKFTKYYAPYLTMLSNPVLPSHLGLDPAKMQEWGFNRHPLSLGPYKIEEWISGDHITLVRNENFWLWKTEGKPYVDTVILRWIESREVGKQLIQTGELDFVWDLIEADIPEAETWKGVVVSMPPSTGTERLLLNLRDPTLDAPCVDWLREDPSPHWALGDPKVREAIELGIDKQLIIDKLLYGLAMVGTTEMNLGWGAPDIPKSEFNPDKAKTLLEEAGWTDTNGDGIRECHGCPYAEEGKVLRLKLQTTSGNALREQCEQVILEMMADIGIEMYIENVPGAELFGSYASGAFRKHGQFDILMFTTSYGTDPHSQMDGYYASYNTPCDDNSGQGYNYARWISDEFDEQMEIAGSSPDLEVRKAAYQRGAELIAEGRPHIYLYDRADIDLLRDNFKGYMGNIWTSTGSWNAEEWYIDRGS